MYSKKRFLSELHNSNSELVHAANLFGISSKISLPAQFDDIIDAYKILNSINSKLQGYSAII